MSPRKFLPIEPVATDADRFISIDPFSIAMSLPTKRAVSELSRQFPPTRHPSAFLSYTGVSGVRFAGCLITADLIDRPIAFCPVLRDLVPGSPMWRLDVSRQLTLASKIVADPDNSALPAMWLRALNSGARDIPAWLLSLACVPITPKWDGGLHYCSPFCPTRFERMARQPYARAWLETHSPSLDVHSSAQRKFTAREKQVFRSLCDGLSEKQIAFALRISVNTVHVYVKQLYRKFGVESRGDLLAAFIDRAAVDMAMGPD